MKTDWPIKKISDFAEVKSGKRLPKGRRLLDQPTHRPYIRLVDIADNRVSAKSMNYLDDETWQKISRYIVNSGDVCLAIVGHTIGLVFFIEDVWDGANLTENAARITNYDGVDSKYLFYYLKSPQGQHDIETRTVGSAQRKLPLYNIRGFPVPVPPHDEQQAISAVLSSFDDKIELNRQMNATLEEMARTIFKSWFVDFDPVHAKARSEQPYGMDAETAALFPDRFEVVNGREVPAGWQVGTLGDIAQNPRRSIRAEEIPLDTPYIGLQHMPQQSIALTDWGRAEEINSNKYEFHQGEFLFGKLRPYFHKVGIAPIDGVSSTDILTVVPKREAMSGLVLAHISSTRFVDYTTAVSTGTRMPRTNWNNMSQFEIVIPTDQVASAYNDLVTPMLELITNNIFESRTLAETRDTLLPHLMSGQLRLS